MSAPVYFAVLGDIQIGSYCERWAAFETDGKLHCGQAQAARARAFIDFAEPVYAPRFYVSLGDQTNNTLADEIPTFRDFLDALPRDVYERFEVVCGNHDVLSTCGKMEDYLHDAFEQVDSATYPGAVERPAYWSRKIEGVRLVGLCSDLYTYAIATHCLNVARTAQCYGDPSPDLGAGDFLDTCTTHEGPTGCKSGKCALLDELRQDQWAFLERERALSDIDRDRAFSVFAHLRFCSGGEPNCDNVGDTLPLDPVGQNRTLDHTVDLMYCGTENGGAPNLFCWRETGAWGCEQARTGGSADESCNTWATGYRARTDLLALFQDIRAPLVWSSGHIGYWDDANEAGWSALGTTVFDFVPIGAWSSIISDTSHIGHVFRVDPDGAVTLVEKWNHTNAAPTIREIGVAGTVTITASQLPYEITFEADDPDYPDFAWDATGAEIGGGCMSFVDGGTSPSDVAALRGVLTIVDCSPNTYGGITVTVNDNNGAPGYDVTTPLTVVVNP